MNSTISYAMEQRNELKAAFICAVQQTRMVKAACALTGTPVTTINTWRSRDSAFRAALRQARQPDPKMSPTELTDRETEILRLMTHGLSRKEIAARLHIGNGTVCMGMNSLYKKLNVHTELRAVAAAHQRGLV